MVALSPQNPSPVIKQSATAFAFAAGLYLVVNVPGFGVTDWSAVWAATALMVLAVGFAVVFTTVHQKTHMVLIVPVLSLFAIGIMQAGVGALFTTLTILPILWIAAEEGRRWVFFTVVAATASLSLEVFWQGEAVVTVHDAARIVFTPLVFGLAAIVINEISRQSRRRVRANRDLMQQREAMLEDAVGYMRQLRENEGRMRAADQLTRSVLNSVTVQAVIGTNLTGLIDVWNPGAQSLLGLEPTEVQSRRHIFDFHVADELENRARELNYPAGATVLNPGFSALVEKARLGGAEEHEWTWVRADGSTLPVSVAVTPRVDQEGATIGYIFVGTDITVRKEVTKLQDEFVGLVSHELCTPLTSILGYLELMREDKESPLSEEHMRFLEVAERNAHRLLHLVGDLLFTAQVASDKFPVKLADVDLRTVITASVTSARPASQASNVLLLHEMAEDVPIITGDAVRLGQACDNLISNAIKFTPRGGTVKVTLKRDGDWVVIAVKDTGMGIPADELDKLSTRFFRASTATRNAVQGVGLGLSVTKAIVTSHHGQLDMESELGVSTTLTMTLPVRQPAEAHSAA